MVISHVVSHRQLPLAPISIMDDQPLERRKIPSSDVFSSIRVWKAHNVDFYEGSTLTAAQVATKPYPSYLLVLPSVGFCKLNVDGSLAGNPGLSGERVVIRDHHGHFCFGFCEYYGISTSLVGECRALLSGIE
ncbi:hypothetical protein ACH5RR_015518 [Cinchona calisaya]|uniref:RNase H type-1 domain-containing protein n=1 Tax=Cinchona calisaya TaxID=153742 RepID=A0ABD2ZTE5_9GENT